MLTGKRILITGGTGSFGNSFVPLTLQKYKPKELIVFSRDEMKQWEMAMKYQNDSRISFVIGDVRDKDRLTSALKHVDHVVHAAATKIVPTAEYNPSECIKTNVLGAMNLIDACREVGVKSCVALSTDKASNPINLYGATKLASDKLFVASNPTDGIESTAFSVVRYGNVMGSRGSITPYLISLKDSGRFPITDPRMTRFMICLKDAVELFWLAFDEMVGGEIFLKKIPSMNIVEIANAVSPDAIHDIIGIRPGEKLHEQMIGSEDADYTFEYDGHFKILPNIHGWSEDPKRIGNGVKVDANFSYQSNLNREWMSSDELKLWINKNLADRLGNH